MGHGVAWMPLKAISKTCDSTTGRTRPTFCILVVFPRAGGSRSFLLARG